VWSYEASVLLGKKNKKSRLQQKGRGERRNKIISVMNGLTETQGLIRCPDRLWQVKGG